MQRRPVINYGRIAQAIDFYKKKDYDYIEVPWLVSKESVDVTKPADSLSFDTFAGSLIASGEQAFIEISEDLCPGRKYQCATPCFRDEEYDKYHLPYFFKVELILPLWKDDDPEKYVQLVRSDALSFFMLHNSYGSKVSVVKTDIGWDINVEGIEVGSYGYREHEGFRWIYGTGLAEPRFSQAYDLTQARLDSESEELLKEFP